MSTPVFKERTNVIATANFRADGAAFPPNTVHWKLINVTADITRVDWQAVTASDSVEISIPAGQLAIYDRNNSKELFELTIVANKDTDTALPNTERFWIIKLKAFD